MERDGFVLWLADSRKLEKQSLVPKKALRLPTNLRFYPHPGRELDCNLNAKLSRGLQGSDVQGEGRVLNLDDRNAVDGVCLTKGKSGDPWEP